MEVTAVILAGGKSSRMGEDKGLLFYNGKPMVQYAIDACRELTSKIFISTANTEYTRFGYELLADNFPGCGPVGGIEAGLSAAKTPGILVCPCDMPGISPGILQHIMQKSEGEKAVVAASAQGKIFPVLGWYSKTALPVIQKQMEEGDYKMLSLLKKLNAETVVVNSDEELSNINYPEELK